MHRAMSQASVLWWLLMGGTLTMRFIDSFVVVSTVGLRVRLERAVGVWVGRGCAVGCLRERACPVWGWFVVSLGRPVSVPLRSLVWGWGWRCLGWFWVCCVCKFSRAHGGCLGTRSR